MSVNLANGTGRRKTSVARVFLRAGTGVVTVNGKSADEYFSTNVYSQRLQQPLVVTDNLTKYDIVINVSGGGVSGQSEACRHGIARALTAEDPTNHGALRANGYLTRDARMVERKKYGQRGARRKFQFSKR